MQLFGEARTDAAGVRALAGEGVRGPAGPLPYLETLQAAFGPGHDLSSVRAHVGGEAAQACEGMGAAAFATGDAVAFAGAPDLHLAAHEAAHVVQQRAGISLERGVGERGDAWERQAEAVAARVDAGQGASDLLPAAAARAGSADVQRYVEGNTDILGLARFADDWSKAVVQERTSGGQTFYALPDKIAAASQALESAGSVVRLEPASDTVDVPKGFLQGVQTLQRVVPVH